MADKIVFDIETKNSFADVGGEVHLRDLSVSVVGAYSYTQDRYFCFDEHELQALGSLLKSAGLLIGFSSKRFDVPVLEKYLDFNLAVLPHFDILEEIEKSFGRRIGLGTLAEANLGTGKTAQGLEAIEFYKRGEMQKLKDYCLQDVKITKEIYDLMRRQGFLWIPERNAVKMAKAYFVFEEENSPQAQLI